MACDLVAVVIAALFVARGGCYYDLVEVDPWDIDRDARAYCGPHPVVAHPPCERWGRYWFGSPLGKERKIKGDDGGCFASALDAVRTFGGVLEHPADSAAWAAHGLVTPPRSGGWVSAGDWIGWTCCVDQGHYGHRAQKSTWLYAAWCDLPSLIWGRCTGKAWIAAMSANRKVERKTIPVEILGRKERAATPLLFRDLLLSIARTSTRGKQ